MHKSQVRRNLQNVVTICYGNEMRKRPPPFTLKHRENIRKGLTGRKRSLEERLAIARGKMGKNNHQYGKKPSFETRLKLSNAAKKYWGPRSNKNRTQEYDRIRHSVEMKLWREAVFKRDKYTCIWCGDDRGRNLNADHIQEFAHYPELRFAIDNGRTLCIPCHKLRHSK